MAPGKALGDQDQAMEYILAYINYNNGYKRVIGNTSAPHNNITNVLLGGKLSLEGSKQSVIYNCSLAT